MSSLKRQNLFKYNFLYRNPQKKKKRRIHITNWFPAIVSSAEEEEEEKKEENGRRKSNKTKFLNLNIGTTCFSFSILHSLNKLNISGLNRWIRICNIVAKCRSERPREEF